ncbi:hypothetical protein ACF063_08880 [Streptomyces chartreusis]|uniref:hypothetical protein n=1 Tax=Streptomyces chartreusis TaxID=1969 RepID=UPI0036F556A7
MSAMVVLALTGFSSGCGHGSRSDASSSRGDAQDPRTSAGGSSGDTHRSQSTHSPTPTASPSSETVKPLKDGTAVLISCASLDDPYATVEVRNPNDRDAVFTMKMTFKDAHGSTMITRTAQVPVPAKGTATDRAAIAGIGTGHVDQIASCEVNPRATADW